MFPGAGFFMSAGGINPAFSASMRKLSVNTGIRTVTLTLYGDGTSGLNNTGAGNSSSSWYTPTTPNVGGQWWVRIRPQAGASSTNYSFTPSTWYQIGTGGTNYAFSNNSTTSEGSGSADVDFSTDGSTVAMTLVGAISWDLGYIP